MRTNKQLQFAELQKEEMHGADLLLGNDLAYISERLDQQREGVKRYEKELKRLIRKALARNWSLKRIAAYSGIEKPAVWVKSK